MCILRHCILCRCSSVFDLFCELFGNLNFRLSRPIYIQLFRDVLTDSTSVNSVARLRCCKAESECGSVYLMLLYLANVSEPSTLDWSRRLQRCGDFGSNVECGHLPWYYCWTWPSQSIARPLDFGTAEITYLGLHIASTTLVTFLRRPKNHTLLYKCRSAIYGRLME